MESGHDEAGPGVKVRGPRREGVLTGAGSEKHRKAHVPSPLSPTPACSGQSLEGATGQQKRGWLAGSGPHITEQRVTVGQELRDRSWNLAWHRVVLFPLSASRAPSDAINVLLVHPRDLPPPEDAGSEGQGTGGGVHGQQELGRAPGDRSSRSARGPLVAPDGRRLMHGASSSKTPELIYRLSLCHDSKE